MSKKTTFAEIIELILDWQLKEAGDQIDQNLTSLSTSDLNKLRLLLDQYRGYQIDFSEAVARLDGDPEQSEFILNQIPDNVRVTHPEYQVLMRNIQAFRDQSALKKAEALVEKAAEYIQIEFNPTRAEEAIENAQRTYPNWDQVSSLRMKIHSTLDLVGKFSKGLSIQKEVSALREKGGLASYQKAMRLINEYATLGLEKLGIKLFDAEMEREELLKMITRAEGESWTHRLSGDDQDLEEILKLEQSIRSLEDAETKNVRVLYNNNARLMNLLLAEIGTLDLSSERAIQADKRIGELREKNSKLKEEAILDVANRGNGYYELALKAFEIGEFATAEDNLRLALEAGTSDSTYAEGEYLGNIELPKETVVRIQELSDRLREARAQREKFGFRLNEIRKAYSDEKFESVSELENWLAEISVFYRLDAATPGLADFRRELTEKLERMRSFSLDLETEKVARALDEGNFDGASETIEALQELKGALTASDRESLKRLEERVRKLRDTRAAAGPSVAEMDRLYEKAVASLQLAEPEHEAYRAAFAAVEARYREAWIDVPLKLSRQFSHQDAILSVIAEKSEAVAAVQRAVEAGRVTEADAAALNELSDSALAEFPAYKTLRKKANRLSVRKEDHIMQDKKEETTAADAGREAAAPFEIKTRRQRIFETLYAFDSGDSYAEAADFIERTLTEEEKEDPAIKFEIDRIYQANRTKQAKFYYSQAGEALERRDYEDAEDFATLSLNELNTVNAAQLLAEVKNRREAQERSLSEIDEFIELELDGSKPLSEEDIETIRRISDRIESFGSFESFDGNGRSRLETADNRIKRLKNQEALDFSNLMRRFETWVMTGEEGLQNAEEVLDAVEKRAWIENHRQEIFEARLRIDEVRNTNQALEILIRQADQFIKIGDFRSAGRIINSFNTENIAAWPDWLSIRHDNASLRIEELKTRYDDVVAQFARDESGSSPILDAVRNVLDPETGGADAISGLLNRLTLMKGTLEKEIEVDPEVNPYPKQCGFLIDTLRWASSIDDAISPSFTKTSELTPEAIFSLRRVGRDLTERIPSGLGSLQGAFDERLKWLETRSQAAQILTSVRESQKRGAKRDGRSQTVDQDLAALGTMALTEREAKTLGELQGERKKRRRAGGILIAILLAILTLIVGLYYYSPKLIMMLTPTPTVTSTVTLTPTATLTPTDTLEPTATGTATATPEPTATITLTPEPTIAPISGQVRRKRIGVYALPTGLSVNLSNGHLAVDSPIEILRYCQPTGTRDYWVLVRYPSAERNNGWVWAYIGDVGQSNISIQPTDVPVNEALEMYPAGFRIPCPLDPNEAMPDQPPG